MIRVSVVILCEEPRKRREKDEPRSYASTLIFLSPDVTANSHATSCCATSCTGDSDTNAATPAWPLRARRVRNTATQNGSTVLKAVNLKTEEHNSIPTKLIISVYMCLIRIVLARDLNPIPTPYSDWQCAASSYLVIAKPPGDVAH